jgi:hypothetical protein
MAAMQSIRAAAPDNPDRLAFFDSIAGLVPVRVLAIVGEGNTSTSRLGLNDAKLLVEVTAARGPYRRGEVLTQHPFQIWARSHVCQSRRGPTYVIVRPHDWRVLIEEGRS